MLGEKTKTDKYHSLNAYYVVGFRLNTSYTLSHLIKQLYEVKNISSFLMKELRVS